MAGNNKYCTFCGKEKSIKGQFYGGIVIYELCECEKVHIEERKKKDNAFALKAAVELRNRSSHLSSLGCKSSFRTAITDSKNEVAINGGKYLLSKLLGEVVDDKKNGLVLQGTRGSGKTYVACAVVNDFNTRYPVSDTVKERLIKERNNGFSLNDFTSVKSPCKFITEADLFALYFDDFNFRKLNGPVDEFKRAQKLLVIDDVGTLDFEKSRVQSMYLSIIDYRYSEKLPIIITTNLNKKELCDYLGDRVFDRLEYCCYFVDMTSQESRRRQE